MALNGIRVGMGGEGREKDGRKAGMSGEERRMVEGDGGMQMHKWLAPAQIIWCLRPAYASIAAIPVAVTTAEGPTNLRVDC